MVGCLVALLARYSVDVKATFLAEYSDDLSEFCEAVVREISVGGGMAVEKVGRMASKVVASKVELRDVQRVLMLGVLKVDVKEKRKGALMVN